MKKYLLAMVVFFGLLAITGPAVAWTPGGNVDTLLTSANVNSGDANELAWVNGYLLANSYITDPFLTMTKYDKNTIGTPMIWQWTGGTGVYAIEFDTEEPAFFFIKTGNLVPGTNPATTNDHFLYQNVADLAWGVVDLGLLGYGIVEVGKISHIGELGTQVPEPSLLLLLGVGLVGIGAAAWRKIK